MDLDYKNTSFTANIADFIYSESNEFPILYRLLGRDSSWQLLESNHRIHFQNLEAGNYRLEVRYSHLPIDDKTSAAIQIILKKPFWKEVWFIILCLISMMMSTWLYAQWRIQLLSKRNNLLQEMVKERTSELEREKETTDNLLHNILPKEVAQELKIHGRSKAKLHNHVTVIFTDFVNFTGISSELNPQALVDLIHLHYAEMDKIIEKYGLEKIKTIGDAYLAVAGLNQEENNNYHAESAVLAAKEILNYIQSSNSIFQIRIGLHSGPIVAGIVGLKKYAYDIWGDTVNTAARMEKNCEPMHINVSQTVYESIKERFKYTSCGNIAVKNKGELAMYYIC